MRHIVFAALFAFVFLGSIPVFAADPIIVGEYGSMTGSEATFGVSTDEGVRLAVKEKNDAGGVLGRPIQLVNLDDQGKQQEATTAVTRLIDENHAVAVLGEVASSLSKVGGRVCQQNGVPMISPSSTNESVTQIGDMVSRVCFIDSFQGYVGASFARNTLKLSKAALLYDKTQAYSKGLGSDFKKQFAKLGGNLVTEQAYSKDDNDYSSQLTAIKNAEPDFIYIPGYYTQVVNIARQARQLGITCPMIGGDGWASDDLKNAGAALDGCYFSDHFSHEDTSPAVQTFLKKYRAAYNHDPDSMAALGYDAANLLFDAMTRAGSTDGKALAAAINSTKDFSAVTGVISIDEHRNARKSAVIQQMKGGSYSFFARVEPPK